MIRKLILSWENFYFVEGSVFIGIGSLYIFDYYVWLIVFSIEGLMVEIEVEK